MSGGGTLAFTIFLSTIREGKQGKEQQQTPPTTTEAKDRLQGNRIRGVHTVVHEAILPRTFVRVRPSQPRTRTKVRVRVRVRRPPTMLDFLYVVHVFDVQMFELAVFR